jgi:hypothetical protein
MQHQSAGVSSFAQSTLRLQPSLTTLFSGGCLLPSLISPGSENITLRVRRIDLAQFLGGA